MNSTLTYRESPLDPLDLVNCSIELAFRAFGFVLGRFFGALDFVADRIGGDAAVELLIWLVAVFLEML